MIRELESATDAACHVLYDPAAIGSSVAKQGSGFCEEQHLAEMRRGNLLLYDTASDGFAFFRICVDEAIPDPFLSHSHEKTEGLLLRVPDGQLVACGIECLGDDEALSRAMPFDPEAPAHVTRVEIPKGNYLVDAYEMAWDREAEIEPALKKEMAGKYARAGTLFPCGCLAIAFGVLSLALAFLVLLTKRYAWPELWPLWLLGLGVVLGPLLWRLVPADYAAKRRAVERKLFPEVILVFRPLPDAADLSLCAGGSFGSGAQGRCG